jgi:hypothetical protein
VVVDVTGRTVSTASTAVRHAVVVSSIHSGMRYEYIFDYFLYPFIRVSLDTDNTILKPKKMILSNNKVYIHDTGQWNNRVFLIS